MSAKPNPQVAAQTTLEGSALAPILLLDEVPVFGVDQGLCRLTLSAFAQDPTPDGQPMMRRIVVAYLRGNANAFRMLRQALDGIDQLVAGGPSAGQSTN